MSRSAHTVEGIQQKSLSLGKEQMSAVGFGFGNAGIVLGDIEGYRGV